MTTNEEKLLTIMDHIRSCTKNNPVKVLSDYRCYKLVNTKDDYRHSIHEREFELCKNN